MTIYRNKIWLPRNYECGSVRFQVTDGEPRNPVSGRVDLENWVALDDAEQSEAASCAELGVDYLAAEYGVEPLSGFSGHRYFGHV